MVVGLWQAFQTNTRTMLDLRTPLSVAAILTPAGVQGWQTYSWILTFKSAVATAFLVPGSQTPGSVIVAGILVEPTVLRWLQFYLVITLYLQRALSYVVRDIYIYIYISNFTYRTKLYSGIYSANWLQSGWTTSQIETFWIFVLFVTIHLLTMRKPNACIPYRMKIYTGFNLATWLTLIKFT